MVNSLYNIRVDISSFLLQNDLNPDRDIIIVASATHKSKSRFFFLLQTEQGDVFKVTTEVDL